MRETLQATGTVRGIFFSLGNTPSEDPTFDCAKAIINLLDNAKKTVHIAIYSITEPNIVNAIIRVHKRNVEIIVIADASQSVGKSQSLAIKKLNDSGVDMRLATLQTALMHNKIGIFDGQIVATGSFNWTVSAEKFNDENLILIDGEDIAKKYEKYVFQRIIQNETLTKPNYN
jgi:phosphatidylserine/phosphatidylglycerophosphate/cardiolipin synthase-like enzyme